MRSNPLFSNIYTAIGWGIGVVMALVMQTSILSNALGPGDLPAAACPEVSIFHIHGTLTKIKEKTTPRTDWTRLTEARSPVQR